MNIIGGPALRRAGKDAVYIWVMTDEKPDSILAFGGLTDESVEDNSISRGRVESSDIVSLGDRLHAALIPLKPDDGVFPADTKIYYDISIDGQNLSGLGLTAGKRSIVYKDQKLPSFHLPTKHHRVLQGSCRKPHAGKLRYAQKDQVLKMDADIGASIAKDLNRRPSLLCLTGDQIYADDVSAPLLCALQDKAKYLTGWHEQLPNDSSTIIPAQIKLGDREKLLNSDNGFSSGHRENHLMTFGEYAAMYLTVWGGITVDLPDYEDQKNRIGIRVRKMRRGRRKIDVTTPIYTDDEYNDEKSIVEKFLKNAWKMRRVMANIVTYMIFDDHEVTDDWNLTKENYQNLRTNPLSRRIQANALAAYWAFQGWGNDPREFNAAFKQSISGFLQSKSHAAATDYENNLLNKKSWGYEVDGYPYMVVLDTRSDRVFDDNDEFSQLMSKPRIDELAVRLKAVSDHYENELDAQSLLLVSPAPILGFKSVERIQLLLDFVPRTIDGEPWIGSEKAFENLKEALKGIAFKYCSVLSGDVHYSYVRQLALERADGSEIQVNQYTSSALHNSPSGVARFFLSMLSDAERSTFSRTYSPYVFPNAVSSGKSKDQEEFLCGHPSYGMLEFADGLPKYNTYYFHDGSRGKSYNWRYTINNPIKFVPNDPVWESS